MLIYPKLHSKSCDYRYSLLFLIECIPSPTIEPNRTQSKLDWVRLLNFCESESLTVFDCRSQSNPIVRLSSIEFDQNRTLDLVRVGTPGCSLLFERADSLKSIWKILQDRQYLVDGYLLFSRDPGRNGKIRNSRRRLWTILHVSIFPTRITFIATLIYLHLFRLWLRFSYFNLLKICILFFLGYGQVRYAKIIKPKVRRVMTV